MTDHELLLTAMQRSGLTTGAFARQVLVRDPRTVRKWKADPNLILPKAVQAHLIAATFPPTPTECPD